jgi:hypothetical protein
MAYSASSRYIKVDGPTLSAECRTIGGSYQLSKLNLSSCLANIDGCLQWAANGEFWASSKDSSVDGSNFEAKCRKINGTYVTSIIDLDEKIANIDGTLVANV